MSGWPLERRSVGIECFADSARLTHDTRFVRKRAGIAGASALCTAQTIMRAPHITSDARQAARGVMPCEVYIAASRNGRREACHAHAGVPACRSCADAGQMVCSNPCAAGKGAQLQHARFRAPHNACVHADLALAIAWPSLPCSGRPGDRSRRCRSTTHTPNAWLTATNRSNADCECPISAAQRAAERAPIQLHGQHGLCVRQADESAFALARLAL